MSAILLEQASSLGMALTPSIGGARAALALCLTFVQCVTVPVFGACVCYARACVRPPAFICSDSSARSAARSTFLPTYTLHLRSARRRQPGRGAWVGHLASAEREGTVLTLDSGLAQTEGPLAASPPAPYLLTPARYQTNYKVSK